MYTSIFSCRLVVRYTIGKDLPQFEPHSSYPTDEWAGEAPSDRTNTALQFAEGLPGVTIGYNKAKDETFHMSEHPDVGIADMLSRPIRILEIDWDPGAAINITTISVLTRILKQKRVANRINNLSFLNATVNIRVVVSGVPQHYGMAICSMNPWYKTDSTDTFIGGNNGPTLNQLVQLPHVFIDPSTSTAGEMVLPLILPHNALILSEEDDINDAMGVHVMSFTPLQSVSPITTKAVIGVWAWLTDVVISNPTSINLPYLTAQSGDEYGKATVSKTATTMSKWSEYFERIPVIGNYARASTMILKGVSSIAELFGYSRPASLKTEMPFQHRNIGNLNYYNCEDTCVKLSLDAKAEVTIDPTISGLALRDEMAISNIITREGYLGSFEWGTVDQSSKILARMCVTPNITRRITTTGILPHVDNVIDFTPLNFIATAFKYWRGTVRFRFVVACSHFHKGRLRIVFEPGTELITSGAPAWCNETNINQSYILDLSESKELTIEVPWATASSYLYTDPALASDRIYHDFTDTQAIVLPTDRMTFNGLIGVHVTVPLTAPTNEQALRVLVFVSGSPDMEFQQPCNHFANYMFESWSAQSGPEADLQADVLTGNQLVTDYHYNANDILQTKEKAMTDKLAEIHFGERIVSIRQLIKRYVHHQHYRVPQGTGNTIHNIEVSNFPSYKGWNSNAFFTDDGDKKFNYARDSFLAYFTLGFLGYRGSIRQKYVVSPIAGNTLYTLAVSNTNSTTPDSRTTIAYSGGTSVIANMINNGYDNRLGSTVVVPSLNNCVEAEIPWYSTSRFHFAKYLNKYFPLTAVPGYDYGKHRVTLSGTVQFNPTLITRHVAAGDDFQLIFFKYAPCGRNVSNPNPKPSD